MDPGTVVKLVTRKRLRPLLGRSDICRLPEEEQTSGIVIKNSIDQCGQITVLCKRGIKYWFARNVEVISESR